MAWQSQSDPALSPSESQFALLSQLGEFQAAYRSRRVSGRQQVLLIAGIFLLLGISIFAQVSSSQKPLTEPPNSTAILNSLALGVGLAFLLLLYAWLFNRRRGSLRVLVYAQGLLWIAGQKREAIRWDQIESVWRHIIQSRGASISGYHLRRNDGKTFRFDGYLIDSMLLGGAIEAEATQRLLPQMLNAYQEGSLVTFGPLSVSQQGIHAGTTIYHWSEIGAVVIATEAVVIQKQGNQGKFLSLSIEQVPNVAVLAALLEAVRPGPGT